MDAKTKLSIVHFLFLGVLLDRGFFPTAAFDWMQDSPRESSLDGGSLDDIGGNRVKRAASNVPECKDGYEKSAFSTMCTPDSPDYIEGTAGVSDADRKLILEAHNDFRSVVEPEAKQMLQLYWDDELAKTAEKWAKQCTPGHNSPRARYIPKYKSIPGQNGAYHFSSWEVVTEAWFNESALFIYGLDAKRYLKRGEKEIGHYSMMVVDRAQLIGCGYAKCKTAVMDFYYCNYLAGPKKVAYPYKAGLSCTGCPGHCRNNLCDCGDSYCFNYGKLNLQTCRCQCMFPWRGNRCLVDPCKGRRCKQRGTLNTDTCVCKCPYPYVGDLCEQKKCDLRPDPNSCRKYKIGYCSIPKVKALCPMLCGVCKDKCPGLRCVNGRKDQTKCRCIYPCPKRFCRNEGRMNLDTCKCECVYPYTGIDCRKKSCTGKRDDRFCKVYWPTFMCYIRRIGFKCPVLCGKCPGSCPKFHCLNYGTKRSDCRCNCNYPFSGRTCEIKKCSKQLDPKSCGSKWPKVFCRRFSNVRAHCPVMCGLCGAVCSGKQCKNGGKLNLDTCKCLCPNAFKGEQCEEAKCEVTKCLNYGKLNYNTCRCECRSNFFGDSCQKWVCPKSDARRCGRQIRQYFCFTRQDVKYICPIMCGRCRT